MGCIFTKEGENTGARHKVLHMLFLSVGMSTYFVSINYFPSDFLMSPPEMFQ